MGVLVSAGHHRLAMRYEAGNGKLAAALAGVLLLVLLGVAERRGWRARWEQMHLALHVRREWLVAGGIALLALPVSIPLVTNKVLYGHDAMCYYTRLAEVQQNLAGGIVVPRWAPDFASGAGQPLFVFHPPLFYWLAELCHLAGFGFTAAVNAATILLVVASAAGIFLLARLYFGEAGGWLAAAAYLYAPYFSVDLFVRCALEEFTSFPFHGAGPVRFWGVREGWQAAPLAAGSSGLCRGDFLLLSRGAAIQPAAGGLRRVHGVEGGILETLVEAGGRGGLWAGAGGDGVAAGHGGAALRVDGARAGRRHALQQSSGRLVSTVLLAVGLWPIGARTP